MSLLHYAAARTAQLAVTGPQTGQSGVSIPAGGRIFLFSGVPPPGAKFLLGSKN